jgi:hypothetical protein
MIAGALRSFDQIGLDVSGNRRKEWNPDRLTALETKR